MLTPQRASRECILPPRGALGGLRARASTPSLGSEDTAAREGSGLRGVGPPMAPLTLGVVFLVVFYW